MSFFFKQLHSLNVFAKNEQNNICEEKIIKTIRYIHIFVHDKLIYVKQGWAKVNREPNNYSALINKLARLFCVKKKASLI